jgi:hypothetical protein
MSSPMSVENIKKHQFEISDSMVNLEAFRNYSCVNCKQKVGTVGVKGVGFRMNAQHLGDIVVEIQCPHCDSGYDLHYRKAALNITNFAEILLGIKLSEPFPAINSLPAPVNSFDIKAQDNNLVDIIIGKEEGLK